MSGISLTNPNHLEWYLSCMLIATAIIYPFLKRYYDVFSRYAAPLIALLILGYIYHDSKYLTGVMNWMGLSYKGMFRAIAEMLLGIWSFELSSYIRRHKHTKKERILYSLVEILCFICTCGYMLLTMRREYEIFALMACLILITIAFSDISYTDKFFQNKLCLVLGKLSLPIYLSQLAAIYLIQSYFMDLQAIPAVLLGVTITLIIALIVMVLGDRLAKYIK